jgi:hypothetical protein
LSVPCRSVTYNVFYPAPYSFELPKNQVCDAYTCINMNWKSKKFDNETLKERHFLELNKHVHVYMVWFFHILC